MKIPDIKKELKNFIKEEDGFTSKSKILLSALVITALTQTKDVKAQHRSCHAERAHVNQAALCTTDACADHGSCSGLIGHGNTAHINAGYGSDHGSTHGNWAHGSTHGSVSKSSPHSNYSAHGSSAGHGSVSSGTLHGNHNHCADEHSNARLDTSPYSFNVRCHANRGDRSYGFYLSTHYTCQLGGCFHRNHNQS